MCVCVCVCVCACVRSCVRACIVGARCCATVHVSSMATCLRYTFYAAQVHTHCTNNRKVADKSRAYKHMSRFLHQALMQTMLICKPCLYAPLIFLPGLYAHRSQASAFDTRTSTTDMAAVLLSVCTVNSACTLDLPVLRLHRSQASTRDRLICI